MITIFGRDNCVFCKQAVNLCEEQGLQFTYKKIGVDVDRETVLEIFPDATTIPIVVIDDKWIGGFIELREIVHMREIVSQEGLTFLKE
jgi:glutaredoxin